MPLEDSIVYGKNTLPRMWEQAETNWVFAFTWILIRICVCVGTQLEKVEVKDLVCCTCLTAQQGKAGNMNAVNEHGSYIWGLNIYTLWVSVLRRFQSKNASNGGKDRDRTD
jgi:hypothetical protein